MTVGGRVRAGWQVVTEMFVCAEAEAFLSAGAASGRAAGGVDNIVL